MTSMNHDVKKIMKMVLELEKLLLLLDECSDKMFHLRSSAAEYNLDSIQNNLCDIEKKLGDMEDLRTQVFKLCDTLRMLTDELLHSEELSEAFCRKRTELTRLIVVNELEAERLDEVKLDVERLEAEMKEAIRKCEELEASKAKIECDAQSRRAEIKRLEELNLQQEQRATAEMQQLEFLKERIKDYQNEWSCIRSEISSLMEYEDELEGSRREDVKKLNELRNRIEQRRTEEQDIQNEIANLQLIDCFAESRRSSDMKKIDVLRCHIQQIQDEERSRREEIERLEEELALIDNQVYNIQLNLGGTSYKLVEVHDNKTQVELSKVQFSVLSPECFQKGKFGMIDVFMYEEAYRKELDRLISEAENAIRETNSGAYIVEENARIRIVLTSPDVEIKDNEDLAVWGGRFLRFSYPVCVPKRYKGKQVQFAASIYINDVIASKIRFVASVSQKYFWNYHPAPKKQRLEITRRDIMSAFISYASKDRSRVAMVVQGIKKARPDLKVFFDVDSLKSGEYWENTIKKEIVARDIFYLFWSNAARESEWVEKEWRYALTQKGLDFIDPIAIDPPATCPPPEELRKKHFNDRMLYYIV